MAAPWRRCKALIKLMSQINAAYPNRDTKSDGSIGDAAHATRSSDHNPWVKDGKMGVVTAQDIDEDLASDVHSIEHIVTAIRKSRDKRVKYIIYEGRITVQGSDLQRWKKYTGKNAHSQHAHISVHSEKKFYDDDSPWDIGVAAPVALPPIAPQKSDTQQPEPPASLVPVVTPVVEVETVTAAPSEPPKPPEEEGTLTKIGNKANAMYTMFGSVVAGVIAWFSSSSGIIVLSVMGAIVLLGGLYMIINWRRGEAKDKRDRADKLELERLAMEERQKREARAHEIQMATLKSAMDPSLQTVRLVPPPPATELPNSDSGGTA